MQFESVLERIITDKLFDGVDAYMVFYFVAITAVFARRRANPAHDCRKRVGIR